jgi:hypothetical protein
MTKRLDPEIKVLRRIARALDAANTLDDKTRRRVLGWTGEKTYSMLRKGRA